MLAITNEQIVDEIRKGHSVKENLGLLYEMNLPLIEKIIRPYITCEDKADLMQEAYFGLYEAVQRYESSRNVRFMTYAAFWIKRSALDYIRRYSSVVRIPGYMRQKMIRLKKEVGKLEQERGCTPTDAEIAARMEMSLDEVQKMRGYLRGVASLDAPLPEDDSLSYLDALQDDFCLEDEVVDKMYAEHSKAGLWDILERYTSDREQAIIKEIFINRRNMAQIAKEQGVGLERIRQVKERGLRRLRIGRAKRELLEKFDIAEAGAYRGSWTSFKEYGSSIVEYTALKRLDAEEQYKRCLIGMEMRDMQNDKTDTT